MPRNAMAHKNKCVCSRYSYRLLDRLENSRVYPFPYNMTLDVFIAEDTIRIDCIENLGEIVETRI